MKFLTKRWESFLAVATIAAGFVVLRPLLQSARGVLESSDEFTLLSLEPNVFKPAAPGARRFHKNIVLGQVQITDPKLKARLCAALFDGISDSAPQAACFNPRHGIRAVKGNRVVDASICFECGHAYFFDWRGRSHQAVSRAPAVVFDAALRASHIYVAPATH